MENKIDNYKIFESVARNNSISRASEELYISQPAVSQSIKKLEENLGAVLFTRTKFGVKLTSEGEVFYKYIKNGLDLIDNGEKVFSHLKNLENGTIRIGASTVITKFVLMPYLKEFHKLYPNINIEIINLLTSDLIVKLKSGLVDFLILNDFELNDSELNITPFKVIQDIFCVAKDYMNIDKTYQIDDLKDFKLITQERPSITRKCLDDFFKNNNIEIKPAIEVVSSSLVCELTKIGFGIGYLTKEFVLDELKNKELFELKLDKLPPKRNIALITKQGTQNSFASQKFIDLIIENKK